MEANSQSLFNIAAISQFVPDELLEVLVALALSFLIGFQVEEEKAKEGRVLWFGGVRAFPLIGLIGFLLGKITDGLPIVLVTGFVCIAGFLWLSYRKKLEMNPRQGLTSEASGLLTYLIGILVYEKDLWLAVAVTVVILLLLELKDVLENLAKKIPPEELSTFTRFLLLTAVILPIVPNQEFTQFRFNPHQIWLMLVVVSGISYLSYWIDRLLGGRKKILTTAVLGGLYSSTFTTIVLAKKSQEADEKDGFLGGMLVASGILYFRVLILISLFDIFYSRQDQAHTVLMVP